MRKKVSLKRKFTYFILLLFSVKIGCTQILELNLARGNSQIYKKHIFTYGLVSTKQKVDFQLFKLNFKLDKKDSLVINLGAGKIEDYLLLYSDTLHDFLNLYIQKKEKNLITVIRVNKNFELLAKIENVEVGRINNNSMFGNERLYFKNTIYAIKTQSDSGGKQFYLNKYIYKSELKNFDYELKWQFPFERKNIHWAHPFYADYYVVLLFVSVNTGPKLGQWVLQIDAKEGKLVKASKLNDKTEKNTYLFGGFSMDTVQKTLSLVGQKLSETQFNPSNPKLIIGGNTATSIYYIKIDSVGEISLKNDYKIPIVDVQVGPKKTLNSYLFKVADVKRNGDGKINIEADIYKNTDQSLCYLYSNTNVYSLSMNEEKMILEKNTVSSNILVEQFYYSKDKQDMNGKLCMDSIAELERLFAKPTTLPVKQQFRIDSEKNSYWILTKSNIKKNSISYNYLIPLNKIYQLKPIEELGKTTNPYFAKLTQNSFLISNEMMEGKYQLKLFTW